MPIYIYLSLFLNHGESIFLVVTFLFDGRIVPKEKFFPVAKENVLWPLTGLVFAGYNALTGSPEESGPPVFRLKLNLTCFPHH